MCTTDTEIIKGQVLAKVTNLVLKKPEGRNWALLAQD